MNRVLLVEDEAALRTLLLKFLERAGYSVVAACGGNEAWDAFHPQQSNFIAAVLDLTLPDTSGEALLERLRESRPTLPAVVLSGTARSVAEFANETSPVRFLQKPFLPGRLVEALAELVPAQSSSESTAS